MMIDFARALLVKPEPCLSTSYQESMYARMRRIHTWQVSVAPFCGLQYSPLRPVKASVPTKLKVKECTSSCAPGQLEIPSKVSYDDCCCALFNDDCCLNLNFVCPLHTRNPGMHACAETHTHISGICSTLLRTPVLSTVPWKSFRPNRIECQGVLLVICPRSKSRATGNTV